MSGRIISGIFRTLTIIVLLFGVLAVSGCIDLFGSEETLVESSWYGKVVDEQGYGYPDVTVTLHIMNSNGEVYSRETVSSSAEPVRGMFVFDRIELRDGSYYGFATCNVTINNTTVSVRGDNQQLIDESSKTVTTMAVGGKNLTVIKYGNSVNEILTIPAQVPGT
ncbi:hypothetical protein [Methanooceanicella nereidis]|nr:hypothetical protein [Methanocella sp. CWC-04]